MFLLDVVDTKFHKEVNKPIRTPPKKRLCRGFCEQGNRCYSSSYNFSYCKCCTTFARKNDSTPVVAFKLQRPIRSKIFNYRQTVMDMNFEHDEEVGFLTNNPPCDCSSSEYRDPSHECVLTGDLRIIKNKKIK